MEHGTGGGPTRRPKEILTLPPLPELRRDVPLHPRTGVPPRPWTITAALVLLELAVLGVAVSYGWHWYRAAFTQTYPGSAHLIGWVEPDPGKWLSLTLEGVIAALAALVGGACGVAGFNGWNGWKASRVLGIVAVALTIVWTVLVSWVGLAAVVPAVLGTALLWFRPSSTFFRHFAQHRVVRPEPYRRPETIHYGRLPRFR